MMLMMLSAYSLAISMVMPWADSWVKENVQCFPETNESVTVASSYRMLQGRYLEKTLFFHSYCVCVRVWCM